MTLLVFEAAVLPDLIRQFPRTLGLDLADWFMNTARDRSRGARRIRAIKVVPSTDEYVRFRVAVEVDGLRGNE